MHHHNFCSQARPISPHIEITRRRGAIQASLFVCFKLNPDLIKCCLKMLLMSRPCASLAQVRSYHLPFSSFELDLGAMRMTLIHYVQSNVMQGSLYNSASIGQIAAHAVAYGAIERAAQNIFLMTDAQTPVDIIDLGCSSGVSSVNLGTRVLNSFRAAGIRKNIRYTFMDLPSNDWQSLLSTVQAAPAFASHQEKVYAYAQAADFFERVAPERSVHLYLSMIALHWMAGPPKEHAASLQAFPSVFAQESEVPTSVKQIWARKAKADLVLFLNLRAKELRPGCDAVLLMVGGDGERDWLGRGGGEKSILQEALCRAADEGEIDKGAPHKAFISTYFRSDLEVQEAVGMVKEFEVVEAKTIVVPIAKGLGRASGAMCDLAWSIFSTSIQASTGLHRSEMKHVRRHLGGVLDERYSSNQGALHAYHLLVVRRRLEI